MPMMLLCIFSRQEYVADLDYDSRFIEGLGLI